MVRLGGDLDAEQLERLEKVARSCPLRRSIEAGIELVEQVERRGSEGRRHHGRLRPQVDEIISVGEFYEKAAGGQIIFT